MSSEWVVWHRRYDRERSLARRLREVQRLLREEIEGRGRLPLRAISLCAGDGRDLIGAVERCAAGDRVSARLIERDPSLVRAGRRRLGKLGWTKIAFAQRDAGRSDAYAGWVPADLVLLCGIFGNLTEADVRNTIRHLPWLAAEGAFVIWTRGRFEPDLTPAIRAWFKEAGCEELAFVAIPRSTAAIGTARFRGSPGRYRRGVRLFTFLPKERRPSVIFEGKEAEGEGQRRPGRPRERSRGGRVRPRGVRRTSRRLRAT